MTHPTTISAPGITLTLYQCDVCTQRTPLTLVTKHGRLCQHCLPTIYGGGRKPAPR